MELNKPLYNIRKYKNMLIIGNLNIDFDNLKNGNIHFSHSNHVNDITCVRSQPDDDNRPVSFHNTSLIKTSQSGCHKTTVSVFRASFNRLPAKVIKYHNYKTFNQNEFF